MRLLMLLVAISSCAPPLTRADELELRLVGLAQCSEARGCEAGLSCVGFRDLPNRYCVEPSAICTLLACRPGEACTLYRPGAVTYGCEALP